MSRTMTEAQREIAEAVGKRIRELRTAQGLSQERLASDAGVSHMTVSRAERAATLAEWDTLERIAARLKVSLRDLVAMRRKLRAHLPPGFRDAA